MPPSDDDGAKRLPATAAAASTRRRRDPEATRAAILDAAERLLVEIGPRATPITEIAREAGVTKSLIHHHFGSKGELWRAVRRRHFERYYEVQKQMLESAGGTVELLRDSIVAYFHFLRDDPRAVRFLAWRLVEAEDPNLDLEEELFSLGVRRIGEAQEAGEIRADLEPISVIKAFLGLITHWFQSKSFMGDGFLCRHLRAELDPARLDQRYLEDVVRIFLEGIRPR